jgi:hypothetical protein
MSVPNNEGESPPATNPPKPKEGRWPPVISMGCIGFFFFLLLLLALAPLLENKLKELVGISYPPRALVQNVAQSLNMFRQEYGRWPVSGGEEHRSDAAMLIHLLGKDTTVNKRAIRFLADLPPAKGKPPVNGMVPVGNSVEILDKWGTHLVIHIDHDTDGWIENPEGPTAASGPKLNLKVAVISTGPDGVLTGLNNEGKDATLDNIRSW